MPKGFAEFLGKLGEMKKINPAGMTAAVLLVKGESQEICPVGITGNLKADVSTDVKVTAAAVIGTVTHNVDYAAYVHEMPAGTNWKKPGAENKFLEKAVTRNEQKIMKLLEGSISI